MLEFLSKLVKTITPRRLAIYSLTAIVSLVLYTAYENRTRLITNLISPQQINAVGFIFDVGAETAATVQYRVKTDQAIVGMGVLSADLRMNEARSIYFFTKNPIFRTIDENLQLSSNARVPLFTTNEENNASVIQLINGQFSCISFSQTLFSRLYPELNNSIRMVCRASIPSYYGYFSGYVSVFLSEELTTEKREQLKLSTDKLAVDIYFRDVLPTQRQEKRKSRPFH